MVMPWAGADLAIDATKWWTDFSPEEHYWLTGEGEFAEALLEGWWDGVLVNPVELLGYWDGSTRQPLAPSP